MSPQLGILDLLRLQGFDRDQRRFKFVRHQQAGVDLNDYLRRAGWFEAYQAFQSRPIFHNIDFIVSFLGMGGTQARLIGVYKVTGVRPGREGTVPPGCPLEEHWLGLSYYYEIEKGERVRGA